MLSYSIAEVRNNFTSVVHEAEDVSPVEVTRHGKPVAMIISINDYRKMTTGKKTFWNAYLEFRDKFNLEKDGLGPDEFNDLRDTSTGRDLAIWD